jgi:hypothetical protein
MDLPMSHPLAVVRAQETMSWAQSKQYVSMMAE